MNNFNNLYDARLANEAETNNVTISKSFVNVLTLNEYKLNAYGITYQFRVESYENVNGYARCLICDLTNNDTYLSDGYLEINGHVIITRWRQEFDYNRENWISTRDLIVEII